MASAEAQERCMMQFVPTVASRPRFPSRLMRTGQYTARSATRSTGHPERATSDLQDPLPRDFINNISSDQPNREAQIPVDFYSSSLSIFLFSTLLLRLSSLDLLYLMSDNSIIRNYPDATYCREGFVSVEAEVWCAGAQTPSAAFSWRIM